VRLVAWPYNPKYSGLSFFRLAALRTLCSVGHVPEYAPSFAKLRALPDKKNPAPEPSFECSGWNTRRLRSFCAHSLFAFLSARRQTVSVRHVQMRHFKFASTRPKPSVNPLKIVRKKSKLLKSKTAGRKPAV